MALAELGREEEDGEDRISQLPEEIIHSILCHMEFPEAAARASVLSRRWLQWWRRYPFFQFNLTKLNQTRFPSFVTSSSKKLHSGSSCAAVAAIDLFCISVDGDFQEEELDRLLLLISDPDGLSPARFELRIRSIELHPCYSLAIPNWSRTRAVSLYGCDFGDRDNLGNAVSLGSLEFLDLCNVNLSDQFLHSFLASVPCLTKLRLHDIFGVDRLEVVSSPRLQHLYLGDIYRVGRLVYRIESRSKKIRRLRISSPELKGFWLRPGMEELEIDAPNLVHLCLLVRPADPITKVKAVNLASNCQSMVSFWEMHTPQWLSLSLSTTFTRFHNLRLVSNFQFSSSSGRQVPLDSSQAECVFPLPTIDQLEYSPHRRSVCSIEEAAHLLDNLFMACHPKIMMITTDREDDMVAECMCCEFLKIGIPNRWGLKVATSWSHRLKDLRIESDTTGEMMEISRIVISSLASRRKLRFMLTWC